MKNANISTLVAVTRKAAIPKAPDTSFINIDHNKATAKLSTELVTINAKIAFLLGPSIM